LTGTAGDTAGGVVAATGTSVAATGTSLTGGALNNPVGITVLNNNVPGTGAGNVVDANVLSTTAPSAAPIQANVLSNGQIVSASIANPTAAKIPVLTPVVNGLPTIVATVPGGAPLGTTVTAVTQGNVTGAVNSVPNSATSAVAGTVAALTNNTPVAGATAPVTNAVSSAGAQLSSGVAGTTAQLGSATTALNGATAPLNSTLNVTVGNTTLVGAPSTPAALSADVLTPSKLLNFTTSATSGLSSGLNHGSLPGLFSK
jgi:hypothetical protein